MYNVVDKERGLYMQTYIFGHRNPDTDTVCSAISLSYLKNKLGGDTTPRVLGDLSKETKYALNYFGVKEPQYLNNVKVQLGNVHYSKGCMVSIYSSVKDVLDYMNKHTLSAVPVVDDNKELVSLITLKEIAMLFINNDVDTLSTNYDNILESLEATEVLRFKDEFEGRLIAGSYQSQTFIEGTKLEENDILIVGNRYRVIKHGINSKISLIIVTGNSEIESDLIELAKENKVSIIKTPKDTFHTCNSVTLSNYVKSVLVNLKPYVVHESDYLTDFVSTAAKLGYTNYPVLNKKNKCVGLLKVTDATKYDKKNVILVDHNNLEQSVSGIDEANIVEVIDHHNLGAIGTNVPINFRSMPVGCTSTILYILYKENNIDIPKDIAGLMLSAILSDTLILKSPTTTDLDREAVEELSHIAEVNYKEYGISMLKAGSSIEGMSIDEVIFQDFKAYKVGNDSLGIGQVITMDYDNIKKDLDMYVNKLNELSKNNYSMVVLFITDIVSNGSYVLYSDNIHDIVESAFGIKELVQGTFIKDVVSRKKQMLPKIMDELEKTN